MNILWRLFTNCTSQEAALKVAAQHFQLAGIEACDISAEVYHKGGFVVSGSSEHRAQCWAEFFVSALASAQKSCHGWMLNGSVWEELDAWSNSSVVSGILSVHMSSIRQESISGPEVAGLGAK